jgi:hypothetical protein
MTEISLWRAGDSKLHILYTSENVSLVSTRIKQSLFSGEAFYASHITGTGSIFIPVEILRTCVITVREAEQPSTAKVQ